jgi:transposase-like protein
MLKSSYFDQSVILLCVRWYLAYNLSLRDLEEMMAERGLSVDHSTIHRGSSASRSCWSDSTDASGPSPANGTSMRPAYRAIDSVGDTVEFFFREHRDLRAAKRFLRIASQRHGRPERIVIDGSQTNREAIISCDGESRLRDRSRRPPKPARIRQSRYLNNRIEQDHRCIKRCIRSMLGFKSQATAAISLPGIEMVHMMRKRQARYAYNPRPSVAEQFDALAA